MKAVMTGLISSGFRILEIHNDDEAAEKTVVAMLADGKLAEAIEIEHPSSLDKSIIKPEHGEGGRFFIGFSPDVCSGVELYGPFNNEYAAEDFGDRYCGEDSEWALFELEEAR